MWLSYDTTSGTSGARPVTSWRDGESAVTPPSADLETGEAWIWSAGFTTPDDDTLAWDEEHGLTVDDTTGVVSNTPSDVLGTTMKDAILEHRKTVLRAAANDQASMYSNLDDDSMDLVAAHFADIDALTEGAADPVFPTVVTTSLRLFLRIWKRSTAIGTVAQVLGLPTGALFEKGSNANGEYVRFADGTQICTIAVSSALGATSAAGSIYKSSAEYDWTFPAAFVSPPTVAADARAGGSVWARGRATSSTAGQIALFAAASSSGPFGIDGLAVGRWY